jgi:hypothetical protein
MMQTFIQPASLGRLTRIRDVYTEKQTAFWSRVRATEWPAFRRLDMTKGVRDTLPPEVPLTDSEAWLPFTPSYMPKHKSYGRKLASGRVVGSRISRVVSNLTDWISPDGGLRCERVAWKTTGWGRPDLHPGHLGQVCSVAGRDAAA